MFGIKTLRKLHNIMFDELQNTSQQSTEDIATNHNEVYYNDEKTFFEKKVKERERERESNKRIKQEEKERESIIDKKLQRENYARNIFGDIVGYDDKKKLISMGYMSGRPTHFLLVGSKGTGKTMFLECLYNNYKEDAVYLSGDGLTSAGLKEKLHGNRPRYIFIDEIDKGDITIQEALLTLTESGKLRKGTKNETWEIDLKCWVMATANNKDYLNEYLADRFIVLEFEPYNVSEFAQIAPTAIKNKIPSISDKIIDAIIEKMIRKKNHSVRLAVKIAGMVSDIDDIDIALNTIK